MKMSKVEFIEQFKKDMEKKEAEKLKGSKAANDFRGCGREKNIIRKKRLSRRYY